MIIKIGNIDYILGFKHDPEHVDEEQPLVKGRTTAYLKNKRTGEFRFNGHSFCSRKDIFTKEVGRKRALERLLQNGGFNHKERKDIWNQYWVSVNKTEYIKD